MEKRFNLPINFLSLSHPIKSAWSEAISNFSLPKSAIILLFLSPNFFPSQNLPFFLFVCVLFLCRSCCSWRCWGDNLLFFIIIIYLLLLLLLLFIIFFRVVTFPLQQKRALEEKLLKIPCREESRKDITR